MGLIHQTLDGPAAPHWPLVLGTGGFTLKFGQFALGGIGTATFGAILLYALLNRRK